MSEMRNAYKILVQELEEKRPFREQGVNGKILLQWRLRK
jgi:hypothetical protein